MSSGRRAAHPAPFAFVAFVALAVLAAACGSFAADEAPAKPAARPVDILPEDSVFVAAADFRVLRQHLPETSLSSVLAMPECQAFLAEPSLQLLGSYLEWRKRWPLLPKVTQLPAATSGQAAFAIRLAKGRNPQGLPEPRLCLALRLRDAEAAAGLATDAAEHMTPMKLPSGEALLRGDGLSFATQGEWVLVASATEDLELLLRAARAGVQRLGGSERWQELEARFGRGWGLAGWADLKPVRERLLSLPEDPNARAAIGDSPAKLWASLGLEGLDGLAACVRLDGPRFDFRVATEAPVAEGRERAGLLKVLEGEGPLPARVLRRVPPGAGWFYATRLAPARLLPLLKQMLETAEGDGLRAQQLGVVLWGFSILSGFDLEKDLLENLGDEWVVSDTAGGGAMMGLLPGFAATGTVKDGAKLSATLDKCFRLLAGEAPPELGARYRQVPVDGTMAHYVALAMFDVSPAWAIQGEHIVFAPTLAALRRQLAHLRDVADAAGRDMRSTLDFQMAWRAAFGTALPVPPATGADDFQLPNALRYMNPAVAHPTRLLGLGVGAAHAFGSEIPRWLHTREGLRRLRARAGLRMLAAGLAAFRDDAKTRGKPADMLPADPRVLIAAAGQGASQAADLESVVYRTPLQLDDPAGTMVAYAPLENMGTHEYEALRLDGRVAVLDPDAARKALREQAAALEKAGRAVREIKGQAPGTGYLSRWLLHAWGLQAAERERAMLDVLKLLRSVDFALLPETEGLERMLPGGLSWTTIDAWGIVSHTQSGYPLPAVDLAGAAVPLAAASLALPEIARTRRTVNESRALEACRALAAAQALYGLFDWDKEGARVYAPSLVALEKHGLLSKEMAEAEALPGVTPVPLDGYFFKLLPKQGPYAPGGARGYVKAGHWADGFAALAYPAQYGKTGRKSFLVSNAGEVYEADLLFLTQSTAEAMDTFDPRPDRGWRIAE